MDSLGEIERLRAENAQLRAGRNQANNQAEFLRQQQALGQYGQNDQAQLNMGAHDWFTQLGIGQQQPAQQQQQPERQITLTAAELQAAIQKGVQQEAQRYVPQQVQGQLSQAQNAQQITQQLQQRLVAEHPDLAQSYAPVIDAVWKAKQLEMKGKTPQEIYDATMQTTLALREHVRKTEGVAAEAPNPYEVGGYGAEMPPWMRPQPQQKPEDMFQAVPGNERAEWKPEVAALNRQRRSKALNTYTAPPRK